MNAYITSIGPLAALAAKLRAEREARRQQQERANRRRRLAMQSTTYQHRRHKP